MVVYLIRKLGVRDPPISHRKLNSWLRHVCPNRKMAEWWFSFVVIGCRIWNSGSRLVVLGNGVASGGGRLGVDGSCVGNLPLLSRGYGCWDGQRDV